MYVMYVLLGLRLHLTTPNNRIRLEFYVQHNAKLRLLAPDAFFVVYISASRKACSIGVAPADSFVADFAPTLKSPWGNTA